MRHLALAAALAAALPACASARPAPSYDPAASPPASDPEEGNGEGTSAVDVGHVILMYVPNRILDLFDIVRVGVNAGPGVGAHAKATEPAQLLFMSRMSAGVGLQGLRRLPVYAAMESGAGVGPLGADANVGVGWYQSPTDLRLELHPLLAGAHVAIDPVEILDFLAGFLTLEVREDDY